MESKEIKPEIINTAKKDPQLNKDKNSSSFTPLNDNKHLDQRMNPNMPSRQNSAFKNFKNDIKAEAANIFPNGTPRKSINSEYFNSIISPFRDCAFVDTPFRHGNYNISSPENLRFNSSPMNGKLKYINLFFFIFFIYIGIIPSDSKNFIYTKNSGDIQGKKIDFNSEFVEYYNNDNKPSGMNQMQNIPQNIPQNINMIKLNQKMQSQQQPNRVYNNINNINNISNNLFNQNSINIINNSIDYSNKKNKMSPTTYMNNMNNMNMNNNNNISTMNNSMNMNINNNNNNMASINNTNNTNKVKCTCSKTNCKKKYCACFSRGNYCDGCECKNCENCPSAHPPYATIPKNDENSENCDFTNNNKLENTNQKSQRIICNCTKSNCMKKYCECFKQGFNCNSLCRCLDCKNKVYSNINSTSNNINNINMNTNYNSNINANMNINMNMNNVNDNNRSYNYISNDSINNNNFYNYALHNNINNNIINNNIINNIPEVRDISNSYIPETFGKSIDYSNPINFQSEAFGIYIEREKLEVRPRKLNLNSSSIITTINYTHKEVKEINTINNSDHNNKETINNNNLNNNFSEINETPKFSNKKRYRGKNDSSTGVKTCPTTNSSNRLKKAVPVVNKNIKKKKLNLN